MKVSLFGSAIMILLGFSFTDAFSFRSSSFTGAPSATFRDVNINNEYCNAKKSYNWGMYNSPSDPHPPGDQIGHSHNAWSVLASTEKWISSTLQTANTGGAPGANNPYARKEVTYVCENQSSGSMIVAGIFRRLKDARELGETHGDAEMERAETLGASSCCLCYGFIDPMGFESNKHNT